MRLSETSGRFLEDLKTQLSSAGANPVVLRNYEALPQEIGNDLDIFVSRSHLQEAIQILNRLALKHGADLGHVHRRDYFHALWLRFENESRFWHIDLYPGALSWHGISYLSEERFLGRGGNFQYWSIPSPSHEAFILLFTSLLWGSYFKDRYQMQITDLLKSFDEKSEFQDLVTSAFGGDFREFSKAVCEGDFSSLNGSGAVQISAGLRRNLKMRSFRKSPLMTSRLLLSHWLGEFRAYAWEKPGVILEVPNGELMAICEIKDQVEMHIGSFFGGVDDQRTSNQGRFKMFLRSLRAQGQNALVLRDGENWAIEGEKGGGEIHFDSLSRRMQEHLLQKMVSAKFFPATNQKQP